MARTRRIKKDGDGHYHLMSRANDRRFLFEKGAIKARTELAERWDDLAAAGFTALLKSVSISGTFETRRLCE